MSYISFVKSNLRLLTFGFLMVFIGNYGQTFFISVFGGVWRSEFGLSHTEYSAYYSSATLLSGFLILWVGAKLDSTSLKTFTLWVVNGTLVATLILALAVHPVMLLAGFFLIRFCGQGLSTHTAFTSMAKLFERNRGKAISFAAMGMPVGEFLLPILATMLTHWVGWRVTWFILAALLVLLFLPWILWSLNRSEHDIEATEQFANDQIETNRITDSITDTKVETESEENVPHYNELSSESNWQRREVVADVRFWVAVPAILSPAVIITGLFFHQIYWAEDRGWDINWLASSMTLYAISHAIGSLLTGPLVDRHGSRVLLRWYLLPLSVSLLGLMSNSFVGWIVFMSLSGLSVGASGPTVGSLWPEVYGTRYLASIRSMVTALMVVSTAIAPVLLGILIDWQIETTHLMMGIFVYSVLALVICQRVYSGPSQRKATTNA